MKVLGLQKGINSIEFIFLAKHGLILKNHNFKEPYKKNEHINMKKNIKKSKTGY